MDEENMIVDLADLLDNVKDDIKNFDDYLNMRSALRREIMIGEIVDGTGPTVAAYIRFWNQKDNENNIPIEEREPIKIYIDSCGGYLVDTFTMIDAIRMSKTPVIGICTGQALSGGFFTFISCHKRLAYPHASFLFHEGATQNGGTSGQFENYASFYRVQLKQLKSIVLENTNISDEEYESMKRDDIWYTTEEAIKKGIVDEVATNFY